MSFRAASLSDVSRDAFLGILDIVYPPQCLICERYGEPVVCQDCHAAFSAVPEPVCSVCGRPVSFSIPCRSCTEAELAWGGWAFTFAHSAGLYEGALRHALHRLKYRHVEPLGPALGEWLANRVVADELFGSGVLNDVSVVVSVPVLPARERRRGFNHTAYLGEPVAKQIGVAFLTGGLKRLPVCPGDRGLGRPQVGLTGRERRANLSEAQFAVRDQAAVSGKAVLLIDDVFTTGATVNACAAALRSAGASRILVATLATGG